jgi:hypothetical protein
MLRHHWGFLATAAVFAASSVSAQQSPELDKVDRMQRQMEQLQEQMRQIKSELAEARKKAAEAKAAETKAEISPALNGAYGADVKPFPAKAPSILDKVKLTWGGFLAAETVYRQHNTVSDMGTPFMPFRIPSRRSSAKANFTAALGRAEFRCWWKARSPRRKSSPATTRWISSASA